MDDEIDLDDHSEIRVATSEMKLLRAQVDVLSASVEKLASKKEVAEVDKKNKARMYSLWLPVGLIFLMVAFNFAIGFRTRDKIDDQQQNTEQVVQLTKEVKALNEQIADCLDPKGKCAEENAKKTQAIVQQIIEGVNAQGATP